MPHPQISADEVTRLLGYYREDIAAIEQRVQQLLTRCSHLRADGSSALGRVWVHKVWRPPFSKTEYGQTCQGCCQDFPVDKDPECKHHTGPESSQQCPASTVPASDSTGAP